MNQSPNADENLTVYFDLMTLARKEMGHYDTKLSKKDFLLFMMQDESELIKWEKEFGLD